MNYPVFVDREFSQRLLPNRFSQTITPKTTSYNGIHNYDTLKMRMSLDGDLIKSASKRPNSVSKSYKRYSVPNAHSANNNQLVLASKAVTRYSSIQYHSPQDYNNYSYFPSRYKYVKGKKRPVAIKVAELIDEQILSKKLQNEFKTTRQQKKKLENDQKFELIKQRYLQLSQSRRLASKNIQKPKSAQPKSAQPIKKINKQKKYEGLIISPWDNENEDIHIF